MIARLRACSLSFALVLAACGDPAPGSSCTSPGDCGQRQVCARIQEGRAACMVPCTEGTRVCSDGTVCLASPEDGLLCWFGGTIPIGLECAADVECEPGSVCASSVCTQACTLVAPDFVSPEDFDPDVVCEPTERCEAVAAGTTDGVCRPDPAALDGAVDGGLDAGVTSP